MTGLIKFIEYYFDREKTYIRNVFRVNVENIETGDGLWIRIRDFNYHTSETITLDEEDLKYLYNKYIPTYHILKEEEVVKRREQNESKIKELEAQIAKLKE